LTARAGPSKVARIPSARRLHLASAKTRQLTPRHIVVGLQQLFPSTVSQLSRSLRRRDDVREEHRREDTIGLGVRSGTGKELLDLVQEAPSISLPDETFAALEVD